MQTTGLYPRLTVREQIELPQGYSIAWSGQYEYMLRAQERLSQVIPLTLVIIFVLLYLTFRHAGQALMVMASLPFALVGGFWLIFLLDFNLSVAVGVGFIALAGAGLTLNDVHLVNVNFSLSPSLFSGQTQAVIGAFRKRPTARHRPLQDRAR